MRGTQGCQGELLSISNVYNIYDACELSYVSYLHEFTLLLTIGTRVTCLCLQYVDKAHSRIHLKSFTP